MRPISPSYLWSKPGPPDSVWQDVSVVKPFELFLSFLLFPLTRFTMPVQPGLMKDGKMGTVVQFSSHHSAGLWPLPRGMAPYAMGAWWGTLPFYGLAWAVLWFCLPFAQVSRFSTWPDIRSHTHILHIFYYSLALFYLYLFLYFIYFVYISL